MKETGIVMSGDHPKLILDGIKTMTRRTWGLEKINLNPDEWVQPFQLEVEPTLWTWRSTKTGEVITLKCPYGQVGDRLWVRETWADMVCVSSTEKGKGKGESNPHYKASSDSTELKILKGHWKPSRFMPRWASRILLEITEVRVERLKDITWEDAVREGVGHSPLALTADDPVEAFAWLWDSINAKSGHGWDKNEWVWPISFKPMLKDNSDYLWR